MMPSQNPPGDRALWRCRFADRKYVVRGDDRQRDARLEHLDQQDLVRLDEVDFPFDEIRDPGDDLGRWRTSASPSLDGDAPPLPRRDAVSEARDRFTEGCDIRCAPQVYRNPLVREAEHAGYARLQDSQPTNRLARIEGGAHRHDTAAPRRDDQRSLVSEAAQAGGDLSPGAAGGSPRYGHEEVPLGIHL